MILLKNVTFLLQKRLDNVPSVHGAVWHSILKHQISEKVVTYSTHTIMLGFGPVFSERCHSPGLHNTCKAVLFTGHYKVSYDTMGDLCQCCDIGGTLDIGTCLSYCKWTIFNSLRPWSYVCSDLCTGHHLICYYHSYRISILVSICTVWLSRTCCSGVEIFIWIIFLTVKHHWHIMSIMYRNYLKWRSNHKKMHNLTPIKWKTYASQWNDIGLHHHRKLRYRWWINEFYYITRWPEQLSEYLLFHRMHQLYPIQNWLCPSRCCNFIFQQNIFYVSKSVPSHK